MDVSGFVDVYYSYNQNRPAAGTATGQVNQLYNFNDMTDQFNLSALKLTLNHDPDPVGAHVDFIYGRTDTLVNGPASADNGKYIEQAYLSLKPVKAKGFEADLGKFVTSAGAEVIEAKDNWNYSRSLLFVNAIPYFHFGLRTSMPVSKVDTVGIQVVNGWNNVTSTNGGVTVGFTNALVKPKYTWSLDDYIGPANYNTETGTRNLIDTTLLLTPNAKFNAYLNYDFGQTRYPVYPKLPEAHWQGFAVAFHEQVTGTQAVSGRYEYFNDPQGNQTGTAQDVQEFTFTYEYKWAEGLLGRLEYRRDWSDVNYFTRGNTIDDVDAQSTVTAGFVAFFGPKR